MTQDGLIYIPDEYTHLNISFIVLEGLYNEFEFEVGRKILRVVLQQLNDIASLSFGQERCSLWVLNIER